MNGPAAPRSRAGGPANLPPLYIITLDSLTTAGFAAIAILLFWRRAEDWLALFDGLMLLLLTAAKVGNYVY